MDFLAVLDYEHLDNGMFLTAFARSLSNKDKRGLIIHGDSEYTERIIQTGVMREDAVVRSIKDLNHRLIALFADEGVSTIGINGFQKSLVTVSNGTVHIDKSQIDHLPEQPMILLSNLCLNSDTNQKEPVPLPDLALILQQSFNINEVTVFSTKEATEIIKEGFPQPAPANSFDPAIKNEHLPQSFRDAPVKVRITTPNKF